MNLKDLKRNWDQFGCTDPMWAILTEPAKKGNKWGSDEFFAIGVEEIEGVFSYLTMLGIKVRTHEALDFGCGLGRLSQALAARFDQVCAVDISSVMIDKARAHNRHGKKCTYYCNPHDNLSMFADGQFDFIYSNLVLQHMEPQYAKKYIREFLRVLHDDGTLLFQAPELHAKSSTANKANDDTSSPSSSGKRSRTLLHAFYWWLKRRWFSQPIMELYGIPKDEMVSFIENLDGRIVDIVLLEEDKFGKFNRYCVVKAKRGLSGEQTRL